MKFKHLVVKKALSGRKKFTYFFNPKELEIREIHIETLIPLILFCGITYNFKHKLWIERV